MSRKVPANLLREKSPKPSDSPDTVKKSGTGDSYADILKNGAVEGMRNHTATKLIGHLLGKGNSEAVVWELVKQWNADKNTPSLDETELRKTFDSIAKLESQNQNQQEKIDVADFFDTTEKIIAEHDESFIKIPFAADNLSTSWNLHEWWSYRGSFLSTRRYPISKQDNAGKQYR